MRHLAIALLVLVGACGDPGAWEMLGPDHQCVQASLNGPYYCTARGHAYLCDYHACAEILPGVQIPGTVR
jgi:hypothetical protein